MGVQGTKVMQVQGITQKKTSNVSGQLKAKEKPPIAHKEVKKEELVKDDYADLMTEGKK